MNQQGSQLGGVELNEASEASAKLYYIRPELKKLSDLDSSIEGGMTCVPEATCGVLS